MPSYEALLQGFPATPPETEVTGTDLAYISFTSGTTGFPKGVMWTHGALLSTLPDNPFPERICLKSRQMVLAPSFVAGSQIQILNGAFHAATMIFMDFDPPGVMRAIEAEKPSLLASAAVMLRLLASLPDAAGRDTSSLKRIYYGGASMGSREEFERIREVFPCEFQQGYGGAETCILITRLHPDDHEHLETPERAARLLSAGRIEPGAEVRLLGPDGKDVLPRGKVGEVAVKAPWVMKGYWNRPEETSHAFSGDGFYRTGDMGFLDREGYLFLVDRTDDMIKSGGLNVFPGEIEAVLCSHPDVEEAAVIGIPHPRWETAVAAVVRTGGNATLRDRDLQDFCRNTLGSYKIPKSFFFTSTPLPRSPLGKVLRRQLRETYGREATPSKQVEAEGRTDTPAGTRKRDPLRHCRRCEFKEVCEQFCYKYFE
jgi:long-chain acyl-CoA synthetase